MSRQSVPESRVPLSHRLLLRLYPAEFRAEYAPDLTSHLALQRAEARYAGGFGSVRFWWDALQDALATSARLRLELARQQLELPAPRRAQLGTFIDALRSDVRHTTRGLLRSPAYALVFIVTLGLGIGANTAMFSAVNGVLLRPLPHDDADRLVYLHHTSRASGGNFVFSVPELHDYRSGTPSLGAVAEFSAMTFTMLGHDSPRRVRSGIVSGNYFDVMGLSTTLGRAIGAEDEGADAAPVVVLSDAYWRTVFAGDRAAIGRSVQINGRSAVIVGVAEPAPPYPEATDIYVNMATSPHHLDATMSHDRRHRMTEAFARLAPGATIASARTEIDAVSGRIHRQHPEAYDAAEGFEVEVTPLKRQLTTRARPAFLLLLGTAFLVLVIACANLANLALTRVIRREHELAVRVSLGASRGALRRELFIENLVLAITGAAVAVLVASLSLDALVLYAARFTSRASEIALDRSVFAFALLAAVSAAAFFTMLPALPDSERVSGVLRTAGRTTSASGARRAQRALVVAQIATSFVLLMGAGLLVRTMVHLSHIDPGFETSTRILAMNIPDASVPPSLSMETRNRYVGMLEDVRAVPGVQAAALTSAIPFGGGGMAFQTTVEVERHQRAPGAAVPTANMRIVSPGYFSLMGIAVRRGREFVSTDIEDAQEVVVINESMAREYFGDRDPIGQRLRWPDPLLSQFMGVAQDWRTIVGVVADTRDRGLDAAVAHTVYHPYPQIHLTSALVVRASADSAAIMPAIRKAILGRNPNQPIENVATLEGISDNSVAPRRLNTLLLTAFAALALIIAAVGIGGVLAFSVSSRTREFGVRTALGAERHHIWSGVIAEGAAMAGIGVAIGALASFALTRVIAGWLVGVPALDPVTFLAVGVLLGLVAVVAAWVPAWRAAAVSPIRALAAE
jgi:putative ABC transport system permease protein